MDDSEWPSLKLTGPDNLAGVAVAEDTTSTVKYESVHVQLADMTKQRDEAWIEIARLKAIIKAQMPPDAYPHPAMPQRGE